MCWLPTANSVLGSRNVCATLDWHLLPKTSLFDHVLLEPAAGASQQSDVPAVMQKREEKHRMSHCVSFFLSFRGRFHVASKIHLKEMAVGKYNELDVYFTTWYSSNHICNGCKPVYNMKYKLIKKKIIDFLSHNSDFVLRIKLTSIGIQHFSLNSELTSWNSIFFAME